MTLRRDDPRFVRFRQEAEETLFALINDLIGSGIDPDDAIHQMERLVIDRLDW